MVGANTGLSGRNYSPFKRYSMCANLIALPVVYLKETKGVVQECIYTQYFNILSISTVSNYISKQGTIDFSKSVIFDRETSRFYDIAISVMEVMQYREMKIRNPIGFDQHRKK